MTFNESRVPMGSNESPLFKLIDNVPFFDEFSEPEKHELIDKQSLIKNIKKKKIIKVIIKNRNLRFKLPLNFEEFLKNNIVKKISRISKYLILHFHNETYCIIHLGMTGTIHLIKRKSC